MPRPSIPQSTEDELLFRADHTCAVCRLKGRDVQIHHIDGNPSNNEPSNLVVLCLDDHSRATGARGLGKSFTRGELRKYKLSWERQVFESRNIHRPSTRYRRELITQVDLIICEILAVKPTSDRAKELLNILFELHLWRGTNEIDSKIVDGLNHLALMSGLGSPHLAGLVAEKLWEMSFHYVGPSDVPMRPEGLALVLKCIDAMSTLLRFNSEFGHGRKATDKILEHSEDLYQIGLWYKKPSITKKIAASYAKGLEASAQEGQSSFPYGKTRIRRSIRNLLRMTAEDKGEWQAQSRALRRLLDEHG